MRELLTERFQQTFGRKAEYIFSVPGRTELGGNHTDHQHGCVLAAAVEREVCAAVSPSADRVVRVHSASYPECVISLDSLSPIAEEAGTSAALIRGVAAGFADAGAELRAFDACIDSEIPSGSGLSSSSAFEVLIAAIFNELGGCGFSPTRLAQISQFAENRYFGKPCGLMDQLTCAHGGIIGIDFANPAEPIITPVGFDFSSCGYTLVIIDTLASHAELTDEYAAITDELGKICETLGKRWLREVSEEEFFSNLPALRTAAGDRAILRAIHFYGENKRAVLQTNALINGDFDTYLRLVRESGQSSWRLLQNIVPTGAVKNQEAAITLALAEKLLDGQGACRIHGGGFAGTIQAYVPNDMLDYFSR